jgi:hypothetical protein
MSSQQERRKIVRKIGQGLVVLIDDKALPVIDISTGGVAFQTLGQVLTGTVHARIARLADITDCVDAKIAVKLSDRTTTRGEFLPTMALLRYIIGHIGEATGTEPSYFKA